MLFRLPAPYGGIAVFVVHTLGLLLLIALCGCRPQTEPSLDTHVSPVALEFVDDDDDRDEEGSFPEWSTDGGHDSTLPAPSPDCYGSTPSESGSLHNEWRCSTLISEVHIQPELRGYNWFFVTNGTHGTDHPNASAERRFPVSHGGSVLITEAPGATVLHLRANVEVDVDTCGANDVLPEVVASSPSVTQQERWDVHIVTENGDAIGAIDFSLTRTIDGLVERPVILPPADEASEGNAPKS